MSARVRIAHRSARGAREEQDDVVVVRHRGAATVAALCDGIANGPDGRECARQTALAAADYLGALPAHRSKIGRYLSQLPGALSARLDSRVERGELEAGAATTLIGAAVLDDECWVVSVGDCRATLIRDGGVVESTIPHNAAYQNWVEGIGISAESHARLARTLTRSITAGTAEPVFDPSILIWSLRAGDVIVLTTDGVHESLTLGAICGVVTHHRHDGVDTIAEAVLDASVASAGAISENATVCCIQVEKGGE